jgi:hypothetical protein
MTWVASCLVFLSLEIQKLENETIFSVFTMQRGPSNLWCGSDWQTRRYSLGCILLLAVASNCSANVSNSITNETFMQTTTPAPLVTCGPGLEPLGNAQQNANTDYMQ